MAESKESKDRVEMKIDRAVLRYLRIRAADQNKALGEVVEEFVIAGFDGHPISATPFALASAS